MVQTKKRRKGCSICRSEHEQQINDLAREGHNPHRIFRMDGVSNETTIRDYIKHCIPLIGEQGEGRASKDHYNHLGGWSGGRLGACSMDQVVPLILNEETGKIERWTERGNDM